MDQESRNLHTLTFLYQPTYINQLLNHIINLNPIHQNTKINPKLLKEIIAEFTRQQIIRVQVKNKRNPEAISLLKLCTFWSNLLFDLLFLRQIEKKYNFLCIGTSMYI